MDEPWDRTVLPLWHRDEDLGALVIEKDYDSSEAMRDDFYFLITIQTVLTEEVASAQTFSQLRKLQRFQERTLDHLRSGIVTVDGDGRVATANAKARELLGADVVEGLPLADRLRLGSEGRIWGNGFRRSPTPRLGPSRAGSPPRTAGNRSRSRWWRRESRESSPATPTTCA